MRHAYACKYVSSNTNNITGLKAYSLSYKDGPFLLLHFFTYLAIQQFFFFLPTYFTQYFSQEITFAQSLALLQCTDCSTYLYQSMYMYIDYDPDPMCTNCSIRVRMYVYLSLSA